MAGYERLLHVDPFGDQGNSNMWTWASVWVDNDDDYIFFRIETGFEMNLQDSYNNITVALDTDNNAGTGASIYGIGAEVLYNFGQRSGSIRLGGSSYPIGHNVIQMISAPTVSSDQFEFAISRSASLLGISLFQGGSVKITIYNDQYNTDRVPNESGGLLYTFDNSDTPPLPEYSISKPSEDLLRILSYNVLFDNLFENPLESNYRRILQALVPDIIGFQEIYNHSSDATAEKVKSLTDPNQTWYHSKIQPDIIAISRYPIEDAHLIPGSNSSGGGNGAFLINLLPQYDSKLIFIVAHTPCCENNSGRQQEIDAIMAFVRGVKTGNSPFSVPEQTPIVIVGDMNLVGNQQQLETLLTGDIINQSLYGADFNPDWDDSAFEDAFPKTSNLPFAFTWFNESSSFSPGRLDCIIYSGSVMTLRNSYTLFTRSLTQSQLFDHYLDTEDVILASDHLPIIADFELGNVSSSATTVDHAHLNIDVSPNPSSSQINVSYNLKEGSFVDIYLLDSKGRKVREVRSGWQGPGQQELKINGTALSGGIYYLRIRMDAYEQTEKIMFIR